MNVDLTVPEIKVMLQGMAEAIVRELCPGGRMEGTVYKAPNPTRAGDSIGSFTVWLRGTSPGAWKEYDDGAKGDIIGLIQYVHGCSKGEAIAWAKRRLGLDHAGPQQREALKRRVAAKIHNRAEDEAPQRAARVARAQAIWQAGHAILPGGAVDSYLKGRRIDLFALAHPEGDLRAAVRLEHWASRSYATVHGRHGMVTPGREWPAMLAPIRQPDDSIRGVHCTFLALDAAGKAPLPNPKLMLGEKMGGLVRLSRGPSGAPWREAREAGRRDLLICGEGIESCLPVAIAVPEARVAAALDLGNLAHIDLSDPLIGELLVLLENDIKPQALRQRDTVLDRLEAEARRHGKRLGTMRPPMGNDFNDF